MYVIVFVLMLLEDTTYNYNFTCTVKRSLCGFMQSVVDKNAP